MTWVPNVWRRSWKRRSRRPAVRRRLLVAAPQGRRVEVAAELTGEDHVVVARPGLTLSEPGEGSGDVGGHRHGAAAARLGRAQDAVGDARAHADVRAGEVDVAPAQGDELAAAQAGERGGEEDRGVLLAVGGADEGHDLFGCEDVDVGGAALDRLLEVADRVERQLVLLAGALPDPEEHVMTLIFVRLFSGRPAPSWAAHASTCSGEMFSIATSPKNGARWVRMIPR